MSHRDVVAALPPGFECSASTATCAVAAMADAGARALRRAVPSRSGAHPRGPGDLANFLFGICGCEKDWDPRDRVPLIEEEIRDAVGDRNVFFFVSGGVDSTVAFTLCLRALGAGTRARHLRGHRA